MNSNIKKIVRRIRPLRALGMCVRKIYSLFLSYEFKGKNLRYKLRLSKKYVIQMIKGLPVEIGIEPISTCPLNCEFCILRKLRTFEKRRKVRMSFDEFKKIVDDISFFCTDVQFSGGEPILNADIFKMFQYCRKNYINSWLATNAQMLDKEKISALLDNPPDVVELAFESPDKETYEKIRRHGNFERLNENIFELIRQKKERKQFYPVIMLQMVLTKVNRYQEKYYHQIVSDMGADFSSIKALGVWPEGDKEYIEKLEKEYIIDKREHPISRHYLDKNGKLIYAKVKKGDCAMLYRSYIGSGGEVFYCWYVFNKSIPVGNAIDMNFVDIWNGNDYKRIRERMFKADAPHGLCVKCIGVDTRQDIKKIIK